MPNRMRRRAIDLPCTAVAEGDALRPAAALEHAGERRLSGIHDDSSGPGERAHAVVELRLDRRQVREYVGVVELEVVEHGRARQVVDELRPLVEERGVVLVRFDDEGLAATDLRGAAEVLRNAADEEARIDSRVGKDPGE